MSCLDDNDVLALASGGVGLSAQRRGEIEAHLDQCGPCRQLVAFSMQALQSQRSLREKRSSPRPPSGQTAPTAPPPATPAREGDAQLGRYRILKAIGAGSMGVVYLAYDPKLDRNVAIKLLRDGEMNEMRVRLFREAQAMARLSHPNVVAVHDVGESGGQVFVAMEFVEGETLTDWLKKDRTRREVMRVFIQAGRGLAAAHAAGIVHRDFKPDNVLISRDGMVRVTDFGLARNQRRSHSLSESEEISISAPGAIIGSPAYMAPEQLRGEQADARADQFAFCVALYEGLGGVRPFAGKSLAELQLAIESRQLQPTRRRLRAYARRALLRGLSGDKSKRFDSMNAVLAALERDPLRRGLVVGAIGAFLLLIGLTVSTQLRARARLCTGAEAEIATAWNSVERAKIAAAFSAARLTDSGDAEQRVFSLLDNYARAWVAMRREACEATRIRGTQTEELFELRMECLDESKQALAVTASVIASGDTKSLHSATEEAATLPLLSSCADQKALRTRRPEPLAVEQRAGRARQLHETG